MGWHEAWRTNNAARLLQESRDEDFQIETRFLSTPSGARQMQGILVQEDPDNYIRFDTYSSGGEIHVNAQYFVDGERYDALFVPNVGTNAAFLRVTRNGDEWTLEYSGDGVNWLSAGSFVFAMSVTAVGPMAGVSGLAQSGYTAEVDYFINTAAADGIETDGAGVGDNGVVITGDAVIPAVPSDNEPSQDVQQPATPVVEPAPVEPTEPEQVTAPSDPEPTPAPAPAPQPEPTPVIVPQPELDGGALTFSGTNTATNEILQNPGIGLTTFHTYDGMVSGFPESTVSYHRFYWKDLEPSRGNINFDMIDSILDRATEAGQTVGFSFGMVGSLSETATPSWLRGMGISGATNSSGHWMPNFNDDTYLREVERIMKALGDRYDGDPRLEHIDVAMVGLWGEWTLLDSFSNGFPSYLYPQESAYKRIIDAHTENFQNSTVIMDVGDPNDGGGPLSYGLDNGTGWRGNSLGDAAWANGWNHMEDFYPMRVDQVDGRDSWKSAPVYFETAWDPQNWQSQYGVDQNEFDMVMDWALDYHTSLVNFRTKDIPTIYEDELDDFLRKVGYQFYVSEQSISSSWQPGAAVRISTSWENIGVAPPTRDFSISYRIRDASGNVVAEFDAQGEQTSDFLPGETNVLTDVFTLPGNFVLQPGYRLDVGVEWEQAAAEELRMIELKLDNALSDGWYELMTFGSAAQGTPTQQPALDSSVPASTPITPALPTTQEASIALEPASLTIPAPSSSGFVSDGFDAGTLGGNWSIGGVPTAIDVVADGGQGYLAIEAPSGWFEPWTTNEAPQVLQAAPDGDFQVEARFLSMLEDHRQIQGIIAVEDEANWLRFDTMVWEGQHVVTANITANGEPDNVLWLAVDEGDAQHLRVTRSGDEWTLEHSADGANWSVAGSFVHAIDPAEIGPFATTGDFADGFTAKVDYFIDTTDGLADAALATLPTPPQSAAQDGGWTSTSILFPSDATEAADTALADGALESVAGSSTGDLVFETGETLGAGLSLDDLVFFNEPTGGDSVDNASF